MLDEIKNSVPKHLAIVMDGNGRWANSRGMMRFFGHRQGKTAVKEIIKASRELQIKYLTLYTFSKENWNRPKQEVEQLMKLLSEAISQESDSLLKNGIKFNVIGNLNSVDEKLKTELLSCIEKTSVNSDMTLNLALSYSSKEEICSAAISLTEKVLKKELSLEQITEEKFQSALYTADMPDVDLLIRTGGESRLSNFLLWQSAYAELYFTDVLWPDFSKQDLIEAIKWWGTRKRRFGLTQQQIDLKNNK